MKYAKVEVESTNGRAVVTRKGTKVVIHIIPSKPAAGPDRELKVDARLIGNELGYDEVDDHLYLAACELQKALDGSKGTQGDIAEYLRVIQHFSD